MSRYCSPLLTLGMLGLVAHLALAGIVPSMVTYYQIRAERERLELEVALQRRQHEALEASCEALENDPAYAERLLKAHEASLSPSGTDSLAAIDVSSASRSALE